MPDRSFSAELPRLEAARRVEAVSEATVLRISDAKVREKLETDLGFASRFYRALCVFLADRLRSTTSRMGYGADFDLLVDSKLAVEVKAREDNASYRAASLKSTLNGARSQLLRRSDAFLRQALGIQP